MYLRKLRIQNHQLANAGTYPDLRRKKTATTILAEFTFSEARHSQREYPLS